MPKDSPTHPGAVSAQPYDPAEFLGDARAIREYLEMARATKDVNLITRSLRVAERARARLQQAIHSAQAEGIAR